MESIEQALKDFATRYKGIGLLSTGSDRVRYTGVLYNVSGSSADPKIDGLGWRKLLISKGIDGDCYVTDPLPDEDGTSHPGFDVGGHMTPNADGHVSLGGDSYLMPLCKWHNSTARDGIPFEHDETEMLVLRGYMQGDLALTFAARLPGDDPFRLVSLEGDAMAAAPIGTPKLRLFSARDTTPSLPRSYLIFRKVEEDGEVRFVIDDANFPDL
jgi:hypothetical protein